MLRARSSYYLKPCPLSEMHPSRVAVGHTCPLMLLPQTTQFSAANLQANLTAFAFDYATRQKVGGTHLTYGYLNQLPVLLPENYLQPALWQPVQTLRDWILPRVLELTYTAYDLEPFAKDCGYDGPPFHWDEERRFLLRCELDAAYFHLYGIARDDVAYIMETFPIVKRKDEAAHGEYRTKRVILEIYDAMQQAIDTGQAYQTLVDPQPAMGAKLSPPAQVTAKAPTPEPAKPAAVVAHSAAASPPTTTVRPVAAMPAGEHLASASRLADGQMTPVPTANSGPVFGATPSRPQQQSFVEPTMSANFRVGDRVKHTTFGEGQVLEVAPSGQDQIVTVLFKTAGKRRLMAKAAKLEPL